MESALLNWLSRPQIQRLLKVETRHLERNLPQLHGHYLLQYSGVNHQAIKNSSLSYQYYASRQGVGDLIMDYESIPLRENSIDCVLMHHVLEFETSPHQCLREAARVVVPNGYLVIVGFNPISIWGLTRYLPRNNTPPGAQFLSKYRLSDWLSLLDFRIEQVETFQAMPPVGLKYFRRFGLRLDKTLSYIGNPFGTVYLIVARKLVAGRTPIRPQWRALSGGRLPMPTPRVGEFRVSKR
ncbi:class I SAM-dependent methyltransferase [Bermanella sp. R86510]|uniref:class I SAM-dependent methyltransferase n=1 Tax=unclassified Bermanella TaxID=2627862 RepID=UPI0037C78EDE